MERNEFSSPALRVAREPGGVRISVPVRSGRFRTVLNLVWLLVWAAGEVSIVLFLLGSFRPLGFAPSVPVPLASLFLAAFTVAGGVVLWRWLWCVGGRETFLVAPDALWARREIWGIGHSRKFELGEIRSVRAAPLKYRLLYPSWSRMLFGRDGNEVVIECAGRTYAYGKGLDEAEALDLVDLLQEEVDFKFRKQRRPGAASASVARSGLNNG